MKKLLVVMLLTMLARPVLAFWPFGDGSLLKAQLAEKVQLCDRLQSEINLVKAKNLKLDTQVGLLNAKNMTLRAQFQAQAMAQAGYQNSITQLTQEVRAGRDAITGSNNTNDKEIFKWQMELQKYQTTVWKWLFGIVFAALAKQTASLMWIQKITLKKLVEDKQSILVGASKTMTAEQFDAMMKERQARDEAKAHASIGHKLWRVANMPRQKSGADNVQKSA